MGAEIVPATAENIAEAARRLRAGKLVAFPTETVYGLGANALDAEAVARIFAAKGRPSTNPLIVHVPDRDAARNLAVDWPDAADRLADAFWPGPLTLVVEKAADIPEIVTAGGPTVGLRVPDHPVALALLREAGIPVAAPSANRSEEVSPTLAQHVADSLGPWVDDLLILDGGPTRVGIESTVVDVTMRRPRVLRPGMVTEAQMERIVGATGGGASEEAGPARAPGQMTRHYAPRTPAYLVPREALREVAHAGDGLLALHSVFADVRCIEMSLVPSRYAERLYAALRELDEAGVVRILIEEPPREAEWAAIWDRLGRAASPGFFPVAGLDLTPPPPLPASLSERPETGERGGEVSESGLGAEPS